MVTAQSLLPLPNVRLLAKTFHGHRDIIRPELSGSESGDSRQGCDQSLASPSTTSAYVDCENDSLLMPEMDNDSRRIHERDSMSSRYYSADDFAIPSPNVLFKKFSRDQRFRKRTQRLVPLSFPLSQSSPDDSAMDEFLECLVDPRDHEKH